MDLLGPSLEDMSWRVAAGGPLSRLTTLMVCDQALERIHAVHEAGYVSICIFIFVIMAIGLTACFVQLFVQVCA